MTPVFLYGPLADPELRQIILGRRVEGRAGLLPDTRLIARAGGSLAALGRDEAGPGAAGLVLDRLRAADLRAIAQLAGGPGAMRRVVMADGAPREVLVPGAPVTDDTAVSAWTLSDWAARWAPTVRLAAAAVMSAEDPAAAMARWTLLLIRAGARLRAVGAPMTAALRRVPAPDDVTEAARRQPYAAYFAVEEYDLSFRRFDGRLSAQVTRAVFISGDAAVVLPYDPRRDEVLVIEQWRAGPHARGDRMAWLLEAVAGRVDGGETPEQAARREALEEAGITLDTLIAAPHCYPSPAAKGEFLYNFIGLADLSQHRGGVGGLPGEGEDIRAHVIPFADLMALVGTGEVNNAPLILLALWLDRTRADLRRAAGAG